MKRSLVILLTAVSISAMTAGTALQKPQRLRQRKPQMVQRMPQTANLKTVFMV